MRTIRTTAFAIALGTCLAIPTFLSVGGAFADEQAERKADKYADQALRWLINEPVTLMDLGMMRLRDDLREASDMLIDLGFTARVPRVGTYFDWRQQKINAYVSIREPYTQPSERTCLEVFERVLRQMAGKSPGGGGSVGWYLESLFSHEGFGNGSRPERMQEGLLRTIEFSVSVLPPDPMRDSRKVQCSGPMDAALSDVRITWS